jgi:hypothetical protein
MTTQFDEEPAQQPVTPITTPWYTQKTAWATIGGVVAAWVPFFVGLFKHAGADALGVLATAAIGTTFAAVGSIFARQGGVQAAAEVGDRAGVLLPAEKEVKKP